MFSGNIPWHWRFPVNPGAIFFHQTHCGILLPWFTFLGPAHGDYTFEEIITHVHNFHAFYINDKFLNADITTNASTQQSPLIRIVPLLSKISL